MKKTRKHKKSTVHHKKHIQITRGMLFVLVFGLLMTIVGLAELLAAPFRGTSLVPASQSAAQNQTKTVTVFLNSGNEDVNGGFAQISFDPNRLSFVALERGGDDYRIIQQQVTSNSVAFEYQSVDRGGTDGQFNIANIKFITKAISGTQTTLLSGSAGAYEGRSSPEYYPASNLSAAITITGPVVSPSPPSPAPPSPSPAPPPTPSPSPSPARPGTPSSPGSPASPASPAPGSPSPSPSGPGSTSENTETTEITEETTSTTDDEPDQLEGLPDEVAEETPESSEQKGSLPPTAILGILILVIDGVFFLYYRKHKFRNGSSYSHSKHPEPSIDIDPMPIPPPQPMPLPSTPAPYVAPPPVDIPPTATPSPVHHTAQSNPGVAIKQTWGDIRKDQAERIAHSDKNLGAEENLPDMFELANQHPESFGSQSLYNEEAGGKPEQPKKPKAT